MRTVTNCHVIIAATLLWSVTVILCDDSKIVATVSTDDYYLMSLQRRPNEDNDSLRASFRATSVEDTDTVVRSTPENEVASNDERATTSLYDVVNPSSTLLTISSYSVEDQRATINYAKDDKTAPRTMIFHRTTSTFSAVYRQVSSTLKSEAEEDKETTILFEPSWFDGSSITSTTTMTTFTKNFHPGLENIPQEIRSLLVILSGEDTSSSTPKPPTSISVSSPMSAAASSRIFVRSSNQKHERKQPGFQDIISGLVKLLGGENVRVANGHLTSMANLTADGDGVLLLGSRINHRAPPKITLAEPNSPVSRLTPSLITSRFTKSPVSGSRKSTIAVSTQPEIRPTSTVHVSISTIGSTFGQQSVPEKTEHRKPPTVESSLSTTPNRPTTLDATGHLTISTKSSGSSLDRVTPTSSTGGIPSGPVTEWLPAHGVAIGFQMKNGHLKRSSSTSVRSSSLNSQEIASKSATSATIIRTLSSTKTKASKDQLPTEISYAEYTPPSKTSSSADSTATRVRPTESLKRPPTYDVPQTKLATNVLPSRPSTSTVNEESVRRPPAAGETVLSMPTRDNPVELDSLSPSVDENKQPAEPPRSPTGSPFVIPVDIQKIRLGQGEVAGHPPNLGGHLTLRQPEEQSVFIDGRKTYFNLMPTETAVGSDSTLVNVGIGYTFPNSGGGGGSGGDKNPLPPSQGTVSNVRLNQPTNPENRPQTHPVRTRTDNKTPIRIDTCIIGDESACNGELNETCRVESGISSCYCRLGYGRDGLEQGCKPIVSLTVYIKVDRVNHEQISYSPEYQNPDSEKYQILEYEARNAVESVFSLSALAETFVGSSINSFFSVNGRVIINATVQLLESTQTRSPTIKQEIRRGLIAVIQQQQQQNIGQSHLYVNGPLNPIPGVQDLDECADSRLNDCSKQANCKNSFGSFKCFCRDGLLDKYGDDQRRSGRICAVCSTQHCNNRGDCVVTDGKKQCECHGNYIGSQCETDGEVLGVALGASLAALLIIVLTLVCLCMWSRRWKRDQQMLGHNTATLNNHYSYFNKPIAQATNFHLPMDDRIGWPPTSDQLDNFYAQPEPIPSGVNLRGCYPPTTRPPSQPPPPPPPPPPSAPQPQSPQQTSPCVTASAGNSTAHRAVQHLRSLPLSLTSSRSNILDDTDEIEENDTSATKFYFPRPKSRGNNANTSNIYYDVTFANGRDQYACAYDKDYGNVSNAFPMKIIRPYHS